MEQSHRVSSQGGFGFNDESALRFKQPDTYQIEIFVSQINVINIQRQLHRHVGGLGERVALPVHRLQERRGRLPHSLPRRPPLHREASLLHGVGGRAVQLQVSKII